MRQGEKEERNERQPKSLLSHAKKGFVCEVLNRKQHGLVAETGIGTW